MEVSSHALAFERIAGLKFVCGAFTNLTEDHLDYHKTMDAYLNEKLKLVNYLKKDATIILNSDDEASEKFKTHKNYKTYGLNGDYKIDGLFINIGYEPSINILKSLDINMDRNYIIVDKNMETSVKGIYACGDIIKKDLYQLVTAVSDGAIAANHIYKTINK